MVFAHRWCLAVAFFAAMLELPASAQVSEFLPEVDLYSGLSPSSQFWFQTKQTREDGAKTQAEIGPSFNFFLKPGAKLRKLTVFDLDDSKRQWLVLSAGYRYLPAAGGPSVNRILLMATTNLPLKTALAFFDRNRLEINFKNGNTYWRYRNRVTLQRTITVHDYHPSLNASAEFFYNSQYGKWSNTSIYAGCIFPLGQKTELNPYYEHANSTGVSPNQQTNAFGLILNLFFRRNE